MLRTRGFSSDFIQNSHSKKRPIREKLSRYFSFGGIPFYAQRKDRSTVTLPLEIVELVIDELQDSRSSLTSCSLVSRSWLPRARYHLFRHVTLDLRSVHLASLQINEFMDQIQLRTDNFRIAIYDNQAIVPIVRGFTMRLNFGCNWDLRGLSPPFTNLKYLRIDFYGMGDHGTGDHCYNFPRLVSILKKNTFLEHLVIENYQFHPRFIPDLLRSLCIHTPHLSALTLRGVLGSLLEVDSIYDGTAEECSEDQAITSPITLQRLYIEECEESVLVEILSSPRLLNLARLRFLGLRPRFWSSLSSSTCEMIQNREFVSQLTHLALGVYTYIHSMGAATTWISPCENVTHLQLIGDTRFRALARVSMLLSLLPVMSGFNKLEHVHISDSPFLIYHRSLDKLLRIVSTSLPSLNRITISSPSRRSQMKASEKGMSKFMLAVRLPKTAASGILDSSKPWEWWLEPKW